MGTTATTLSSAPGMATTWVLVIEGFEYLITDGDTAAVLTAWAEATEWSAALGGLFITSGFQQSMDPWNPFVPCGDLTFVVRDVGDDVFGRAVFQRGGGDETYLAATIDGDITTATVKSAAEYASSGSIHIGAERATYSGKTSTTFTGLTRGRCAPFAADTETASRFGRYHRAGVTARSTGVNAIVSSGPRTWHGKWVGLWMHRRLGGVLDTRSQAQCVWAGTIAEITDGSNGDTQVTCKHVTAKVPETMLLRDQWTAEAAEGVYVAAGGPDFESSIGSNELVVVASGATPPYEMNAGYYTVEQLISVLNAWTSAELAGSGLSDAVVFSIVEVNGIGVVQVEYRGNLYFEFSGPAQVWTAMGFPQAVAPAVGEARVIAGVAVIRAPDPPWAVSFWSQVNAAGTSTDVINASGSFVDQRDTLPLIYRNKPEVRASSDPWGFILVGGTLFLAELIVDGGSTATFGTIMVVSEYQPLTNQQIVEAGRATEGPLVIRQVVILEDTFTRLLPRLLASTGTTAYNHVTYDRLGHGLGCGIPWGLLGQSFVDSCALLGESAGLLRVVIEKPTTLAQAIGADLMLRKASLIWKNGGLRLASWSSLTASRALHVLTEENKGAPADQRDAQRTPLIATDQWLRNVLKIEYDRVMFTDDYESTFQWEDRASMDDVGEERPVTIRARNAYQAAGDVIEELAAGLFSSMPFFARPVLMLRRTIDMSLFEGVAPGDLVLVSDEFARDPTTGLRGLVEKPGIIIAHRWDRGGADPSNPKEPRPMMGEVDIAIEAIDRTFAWAPAAMVDETANTGGFTAGYNSGTNTIRCKANEYTLSADGVLDVTYFEVGDSVEVIEVDPAGGTSQTWSRGINSKSNNDLTLSAALTGFDTAKRYRVVPQDYASCVAGQLDVAFQADDADARVEDSADPYLWGEEYGLETNQPPAWSLADLPERYSSTSYGDGRPLDVGFETGLVRMAINLTNYKTAPQMPCLDASARNHASVTSFKLHAVIPYFVGHAYFPAGYTRKLYVAPLFRSSSGASVQVRVTLCRDPPKGASLEDVDIVGVGTVVSTTFTTTSTTFTQPTAVGFPVDNILDGTCFVIVEVNSSAAQVYGLGVLRLGPLETA
jgi:hypothetical protein